MADERTRYSDAELEEFRQLILKKLENARADYELLRATITHTADNDTEDTSPTFKVLEEGAATLSKEESGRLAAHQMKFIRNLEMALVRIENKTYGICKNDRKAHSQGAADESAPRHGMHRGQRGPQIRRGRDDPHSTLNGKWKKTTFGPSFSSSPGEGVAAKKREGWKTPIISHAGSCTRRRDGIIGIWVSNPQFRPLCRTFCRKNPLSLTQCSPGSAYFP